MYLYISMYYSYNLSIYSCIVITRVFSLFPWTGQCYMPLGIEDKRIPSENLRASTFYNPVHSNPSQSRLNNYKYATAYYGWRSRQTKNQWLQCDIGRLARVTGVATQSARGQNAWVKRYTISYSNNGRSFKRYKAYGREKVFSGNYDNYHVVAHKFAPNVKARYIRLHPIAYRSYITLRWELYGCRYGGKTRIGLPLVQYSVTV